MVIRSKTLRLLIVIGGVSPLGKDTGFTGAARERHGRRPSRQHPVVNYERTATDRSDAISRRWPPPTPS